jgi:hypothetical protein
MGTIEESGRLLARLEVELGERATDRSTGATDRQLRLAQDLITRIAQDLEVGRTPRGALSQFVADQFNPSAILAGDLIEFEQTAIEAARRGSRDIHQR